MARDPRHLPGPAWVDAAWTDAPVSPIWRRNLQALFDAGRLRETGLLCLLELEGTPAPDWADIAVDGGCSGLVVPAAALPLFAFHAHRVPLIVRIGEPSELPAARDGGAVAVAIDDPAAAAAFGLPALCTRDLPGAALVEGPTDGPALSLALLRTGESVTVAGGGARVVLAADTPDAERVARLHAVQDVLSGYSAG